tara:strand:- start:4912 stop:5139 length:228 start_codon:yes stop_codon:yes gene_type:complete
MSERKISNFVTAYCVAGSIDDDGGRWFFIETDDGYFELISKRRQVNGTWWLSKTDVTLTPSAHQKFMKYLGENNG